MTKVDLHKAIEEALKATNISEAKRIFSEVYYEVHPQKISSMKWNRVKAGAYKSEDGVYEIIEVPETKERRYYWNILKEGKKIGEEEILSTSKEFAEEDKRNSK